MTMTTTLRGIEITELLHMIRAFDGAGNLILVELKTGSNRLRRYKQFGSYC